MKKLLSPKVLLPLILSAGIIAALLAFANLGTVIKLMLGFNRLYLLFFLLLMVVYETIRGLQWHFLLKSLGIHAPLKSQWFAFLVGETAKSLPIGNYVQNYLLERSQGEDIGRSSAASTLIIITEVFVSVIGVLILGVGSWTSWLRRVIIIGSAVFAGAVALVVHLHQKGQAPRWMTTHKSMKRVLEELGQFKAGAIDLLHPRVLVIETLLSTLYLITAGGGLYIVTLGLHIANVTFGDALAVYLFSLGFSLIFPLPIDIGVAELSGVGAFLAVGVARSGAVGAMLINRVLSIGSALTIGIITMIVWHDELMAALREHPEHRNRKRSQGGAGAKSSEDAHSPNAAGTTSSGDRPRPTPAAPTSTPAHS